MKYYFKKESLPNTQKSKKAPLLNVSFFSSIALFVHSLVVVICLYLSSPLDN